MIEKDVAMLLKGTHQKITQLMQQKIDEYGLTFGQLHLMILIKKYPDVSQKYLAKEMRFTEGAMSGVVKRLISLSMIDQITLESDMRYKRLVLTDMGQSMINDYKEHVHIKYDDMFAGFNNEELIELNGFLLKINKNLDNINNNETKNIKI